MLGLFASRCFRNRPPSTVREQVAGVGRPRTMEINPAAIWGSKECQSSLYDGVIFHLGFPMPKAESLAVPRTS